MRESDEVRRAVLDFYRGVSNTEIERFDEIVSAHPATLVIGTAIGEWVTERPRLRSGLEAEGLTVEAGPSPAGHADDGLGWFVDEPRFVLPDGSGYRTRLTAVGHREDERWKIVHMHWSVGVPDDEVITLQQRWVVV